MKPMYEISDAFIDIATNEELTGEEVHVQLTQLEMELEAKVSNGIGVIQTLKVAAEGMKAEESRLKLRRLAIENRISNIKEYYQGELARMGKKKIMTSRGSMSIAKCGGKLPMKIDDENLIPQEYKRIVYEVDKEKLRGALEDGEYIEGAHLEERGSYLKIS